ncbi:MAG: glycoside hydrolase family 3 protein [Candidatus Kapabacteria bacterium]|nr:glycoside hydrolase family 3 protein [Candidatus Kapabacteria bacterium]
MRKSQYTEYLEDLEFISAQVVFPRISADEFNDNNYKKKIYELVEKNIGGFCVFQGELNETYNMINDLQSRAKVPLLFCSDFENGLPMRLRGGTEFPHLMALGKVNDTKLTYQIAKSIAIESKKIGIHWNLAPVADINSNKKNPIINIRSFGETPEIVSKHVEAYINGMQSENVLACAKHFPGHGDTYLDSHITLPVLNHLENRIRSIELQPFITAINNNVKSIMIGHLAVPSIDSDSIPATLSPKILGILRNELKYQGLVVSDALDMKAITSNFSNSEAAIKAVYAGCNILLLPPEPSEAIDSLINESTKNVDFRNYLKFSATKILEAKNWAGLFNTNQSTNENTNFSIEHEKLALKTAYRAIEITGNTDLMPIPNNQKFAGFAFIQDDNLEKPTLFFKILAQAVDNDCDFGFVDDNITNEELNNLLNSVGKVDFFLLAFFYKAKAYSGSIDISDKLRIIVEKLSGKSKAIAVFFGNPYLAEKINADLKLNTFSDSLPSIAASILYLSGRKPI